MKILAFVPIKLTLFLILGILIGSHFKIDVRITLGATLFLITVLGLLFQFYRDSKPVLFACIAALTTIALGVFVITQAQPTNHNSHYSNLNLKDNKQWNLKIKEVLKPTSFSQRYVATVQSLDNSSSTGKILLSKNLDSVGKNLSVDDELVVNADVQLIRPPLNPYQFDYKSYLEELGIYHQLRLHETNYFTLDNPSTTIFGLATKARNHIIKKLKESDFGPEELGVIQALLLGQRSDISDETYNNYKNAGAVHILAVSGLHIGVLLLLLQFILSPLKNLPKGKTIILILSVVLLWCFAVLAGLSPSIIRACAMFTFVAYALYLNRPSNTFNILALSMFFVLLFINPNLLFQVGFQMSYAAVFAIVWLYPLLQKLWFPKNKIVRYIWQLFSVSIAAQLGVLPISLFYFHQFPGLFFISNLLIIPALGFILGTGILVIAVSLLNLLPKWLAWFFNELISWMNTVVGWVAQQEAFIFKSIHFDNVQLILAYLLIIAFVLVLTHINFKRIAFFLLSLLCFQCWTIYQEYSASKTNEVLVLHQTKNPIVLYKKGKGLNVLTGDSNASEKLINDYQIGERINTIQYDTLAKSYTVVEKPLLVIDSLGIYTEQSSEAIVLLTYSPKINLERLLQNIHPKEIIADGSNYKSYVERWKKTCIKNKIPFHYTGEKGAYYFKSLTD